MARQRPVDESGITDCVSSLLFVLFLSCSLCCSLSAQTVACSVVAVSVEFGCRFVPLLVVLSFSIGFCCRFILRCCAHVIILLELRLPFFGWPCVPVIRA